jgi:hypothetical protein
MLQLRHEAGEIVTGTREAGILRRAGEEFLALPKIN